jgi:hypothetical protein
MALPISVGTQSESVYTSHYYGPLNLGTTLDIAENHYTEASTIGIEAPSFAFRNLCSAQTFGEMVDFFVEYTDMGDYVVFATSSRKDAYLKSDLAKYGMIHSPDESADMMDGWIDATVPKEGESLAIEYVEPNERIGLFVMPEHQIDYSRFDMTDVDLHVKDFSATIPMNEFGKYLSMVANMEIDLRDVIYENGDFNPETVAFLQFMMDEGLGPGKEIEALGVMNLDRTIARTYGDKETAMLVASTDIYDKALYIAESNGISGNEAVAFAKRAVWYHELYHVFDNREGMSEKKIEMDVGNGLADFFGKRASMLEEKLSKYSSAMEEWAADYAKTWKPLNSKSSKSLMSELESLASEYISEAKAKGLQGEEAVDYVESKLDNYIAEVVGNEGSKTKQSSAKDSKYSKRAKVRTSEKGSGDGNSDTASEDGGTASDDCADDEGGEEEGGGEE